MKIMIEQAEGCSHLDVLRFGGPIVHQNIVRPRHIVPFEKDKPARNITETLLVDTINYVYAARRAELQQHGGNGLHIFHLAKLVANLDGHGGAAERQENGRGRWLEHDVRAYAFDALGRLLQQAASEPNDQDHERHLDAHSDHAHNRSDRTAPHVINDQLLNHGCVPACSSPTRTSSVPPGWASSKRSAVISSFTVSLRMRISSL